MGFIFSYPTGRCKLGGSWIYTEETGGFAQSLRNDFQMMMNKWQLETFNLLAPH